MTRDEILALPADDILDAEIADLIELQQPAYVNLRREFEPRWPPSFSSRWDLAGFLYDKMAKAWGYIELAFYGDTYHCRNHTDEGLGRNDDDPKIDGSGDTGPQAISRAFVLWQRRIKRRAKH